MPQQSPEEIASEVADTIRWDENDRATITESHLCSLIEDAMTRDRAARDIPARPNHTPSELAEAAAAAVVTARALKRDDGETYVQALSSALGDQIAHERGLALFATAAADLSRESNTRTPEEAANAVVVENYGRDGDADVYSYAATYISDEFETPTPRELLASALTLLHLDADGILAMLRAAARAGARTQIPIAALTPATGGAR